MRYQRRSTHVHLRRAASLLDRPSSLDNQSRQASFGRAVAPSAANAMTIHASAGSFGSEVTAASSAGVRVGGAPSVLNRHDRALLFRLDGMLRKLDETMNRNGAIKSSSLTLIWRAALMFLRRLRVA